jgi:mono/diheme cytochrome c family protein
MTTARIVAVTVAVTLVVTAILGMTFVYSGLYNVSAASSHSGLVAGALHTIADRSIDTHAAHAPEPPVIDSAAMLEGAEHFHAMCAVCHGAPGFAREEIAEGLNPDAPELSKHAAGEFSEAQLYWIIRNGIKFTGMPSFEKSHTDEQIWAIAKFTKSLDGMTDAQYEAVIRRVMAANGGVMPGTQPQHMH